MRFMIIGVMDVWVECYGKVEKEVEEGSREYLVREVGVPSSIDRNSANAIEYEESDTWSRFAVMEVATKTKISMAEA